MINEKILISKAPNPATQTIRGLTSGSTIGSMVSPFAPITGADVKLSLDQQSIYGAANYFSPLYSAGGKFSDAGTQQLVVQPFACKDSTGASNIQNSGTSFLDGTTLGINGLDVVGITPGSLDPSTQYFIYFIGGAAVPGATILSTSPSFPSLVNCAGYSYFSIQRGSATTDVSGNLIASSFYDNINPLPSNNPTFTGNLSGLGFSWQPASNNLSIGLGASALGGDNNIGLGNYPQSGGFSGCDIANDSTTTAINSRAPTADNQYVKRFSGGIGFNTGVNGLQCGYHFGAFDNALPGMMFTTNFIVADANMQSYDVNPNVSGNILSFKWSGSTGTKFTVSFPAASGSVPLLSTNNAFTQPNSFSSSIAVREMSAPLPLVKAPVTLTANSGTIVNGQLVGSIILFSPTANSTWVLPAAADIDSVLNTIDTSRGLRVRMINTTLFTVSVLQSADASTTLAGFNGGVITIPAGGEINVDVVKIASSPSAYTIFGAPARNIVTVITGTTILTSAAFGTTVICQGGSSYTVTLPAVNAGLNQQINLQFQTNAGVIVSVAPPTGTIVGQSSIPYIANESAIFSTNGSAWFLSSQSLVPVTCSYGLATTPTATTGTRTVVFDTKQSDVNNYYNAGLFTPLAPGNYVVTTTLRISTGSTGFIIISLIGPTKTLTVQGQGSGSGGSSFQINGLLFFNGSTDNASMTFNSTISESYGAPVANNYFSFTRVSNF
jgi:hypothetical protein